MRLLLITATAVCLSFGAGQAVAQDFDKGTAAFESGDFESAFSEWLPLAENGMVEAQYNLGLMFANGSGRPRDYAAAAEWWHLAAKAGDTEAQWNLGVLYKTGGFGIEQDFAAAVSLWMLAATQGHRDAQYMVGLAYRDGIGLLAKDTTQAIHYWRLAAESGHAKSQLQLGMAFALGEGVPLDPRMAHMWFEIALANGNRDAQSYLELSATLLPPVELQDARIMAGNCVGSGYKECGL
jgi:TPR repeat protein